MSKKLSQELAEKAQQEGTRLRGAGRASFLALKADIQETIEEGWPVKDVWRLLHDDGRVPVTYQAFNVYVNRYIRLCEHPHKDPDAMTKTATPLKKSGLLLNPYLKSEEVL